MRQWQQQMADAGTVPATIGLKLSAVSFYLRDQRERMALAEMCLFGMPWAMPRRTCSASGNITRPKESSEMRESAPAAAGALRFVHLPARAPAHAGRRPQLCPDPVLPGDRFRNGKWCGCSGSTSAPARGARRIIYAWAGKGGKTEDEPLPEIVWNAIVHYLFLDGRWISTQCTSSPAAGRLHFPCRVPPRHGLSFNVDDFDPDGAISGRRAAHLRTALRKAGIADWKPCVHDLRHTWALRMVADGGERQREVQQRAHHSSLETTALHRQPEAEEPGPEGRAQRAACRPVAYAFADGDAPGVGRRVI